jgi:dihydrolipoamide dehydrogenase
VKLEVGRDAARVTWSGSSRGARSFERILVATGRPSQLEDLNLSSTGLPLDERGVPRFDRATLQRDNAPIFVVGDANRERPVLHEASLQGATAGRNAAAFPDVRPGVRPVPLSSVFTDPPLATIGTPKSDFAVVGPGSYSDQGRANIDARATGLVRIYANRASGKLTGAVLFGPGIDHIAHLIAWAIERGETAAGLLKLPFYHPTLEEGLKQPLRQICEAIGSPDRQMTLASHHPTPPVLADVAF